MKAALNYLESYAQQLDAVNEPKQLWADILDWQYHQHTFSLSSQDLPLGRHVQRKITEVLIDPRNDQARLQDAHLPTTAIGGFKGIVVLSANPHFNSTRNRLEMQIRNSSQANQDFCAFPFSNHLSYFRESGWWRNVVRFGQSALGDKDFPTEMWEWASQGRVGAIDLVPFHSSEDRLTNLLLGTPRDMGERGQLRVALTRVAESTIRMALRFEPKVLVAASRSGAVLATHLANRLVRNGFARRLPDMLVHCDRPTEINGLVWQRQDTHRLFCFEVWGESRTLYVPLNPPWPSLLCYGNASFGQGAAGGKDS